MLKFKKNKQKTSWKVWNRWWGIQGWGIQGWGNRCWGDLWRGNRQRGVQCTGGRWRSRSLLHGSWQQSRTLCLEGWPFRTLFFELSYWEVLWKLTYQNLVSWWSGVGNLSTLRLPTNKLATWRPAALNLVTLRPAALTWRLEKSLENNSVILKSMPNSLQAQLTNKRI